MVSIRVALSGLVSLCILLAGVASAGQLASATYSPSSIVWQPLVINGGVTLSVTGPGNTAVRHEFGAGDSPAMGLTDNSGDALPDGQYSYELVFTPTSGTVTRHDNSPAAATAVEPMIQSGSFRIVEGQFFVPSSAGESSGIRAQAVRDGVTPLDVVHADDVIVTGSLCVGFDCLTDGTENFGFDTIKMKENNTRLKFDDTSSTAGFPANDWTIVANDSSSGGANYLAFEDTTGAKTPFKVMAGAATNSLFVSSTGRVGLGTGAPVLNLHINAGDTPSMRLEQNTSSGWTAQTWDIAGNESNFFVRDVTGGSKLPFRIQPGTPTNALTLRADGSVGIGTWSPSARLEITGTQAAGLRYLRTDAKDARLQVGDPGKRWSMAVGWATQGDFSIIEEGASGNRLYIQQGGNVGIGTSNPTHRLVVCDSSGTVCSYSDGGTTWTASSREYKQNVQELSSEKATETLRNLTPVTYTYKVMPDQGHVGFIAEDVPDLVAAKDRKALSPMDIVAVLTKVVQEQGNTINELKSELALIKGMMSGDKQ